MITRQKIINLMKNPMIYLFAVYILMLLVIFILPFYSFEKYSIIRNTTSQLGAQKAPNAWLMNLTFVLLGVASVINGWRFLGQYWFHKIVILIFGVSLVMTAFFQHSPLDITINYNIMEDKLHSLFATIVGVSFTILAISIGFIEKNRINQILAITSGVLATILSILMFKIEAYMGIWQRMIFICSFGWMIYAFKKYEL